MILDTKVNPNSLTPGFFVVENGIIDKDFVLVGNATHPLPLNQFYIIICTNYDYKIMWQESCYPTTYISKKSDYLTFGSHIDNTIAYEVQDDDVSYTYECYDDKFLKIPRNIKDILISDVAKFIHIMLVELIRLDYNKYKIVTIDKSLKKWGNNVAVGYNTLFNNAGGASNTAIGYNALHNNVGGTSNIAIGYNTLIHNTIGYNNLI